jgi:hypothetical protein
MTFQKHDDADVSIRLHSLVSGFIEDPFALAHKNDSFAAANQRLRGKKKAKLRAKTKFLHHTGSNCESSGVKLLRITAGRHNQLGHGGLIIRKLTI